MEPVASAAPSRPTSPRVPLPAPGGGPPFASAASSDTLCAGQGLGAREVYPSPVFSDLAREPVGEATGLHGRARPLRLSSLRAPGGGDDGAAQDREGAAGGWPRVLLLRHRLGYSTVALSRRQRLSYTRNDLEDFLLYKEQKYNAVNVLYRFCVFLLLTSTVSTFCLAVSVCSTEWHVAWYEEFFLGIGIFVSCSASQPQQCTSRRSSFFARSVLNDRTGEPVCDVTKEWARKYIGAMWTFGILHLLGQALTLAITLYVSFRPTRSQAATYVVWILLLCVLLGVLNCILFPQYVQCDRRACSVPHTTTTGGLSRGLCSVSYGWGYKLYISATALHAVCLLMAFLMQGYVGGIRRRARAQLQQERWRKSVEAAAKQFARSVRDDNTTNVGTVYLGRSLGRAGGGEGSMVLSSSVRAGGSPQLGPRGGSAWPMSNNASIIMDSAHRGYVSMHSFSTPGAHTGLLGDPGEAGITSSPSCVLISRSGSPGAHGRGGGVTIQQTVVPVPARQLSLQASLMSSTRAAPLPRRSVPATVTVTDLLPPPHAGSNVHPGGGVVDRHVSVSLSPESSFYPAGGGGGGGGEGVGAALLAGPSPRLGHGEPSGYRRAHRELRRLQKVMESELESSYLTAAELGVRIPGARDWVYDEKSDMYYSFDRDMFWDPLTTEYFNCVLRSWHESPDSIVDIRDAMRYHLGEDDGEYGREGEESGWGE